MRLTVGHLLFVVLHLIALLFTGAILLFLTIPAHLIYAAVSGRRQPPAPAQIEAVDPSTHVRCPDCRELVRRDALKCKHCGTALVPQPAPPAATPGSDTRALLITVAVVAVMFCIALLISWVSK